MKQIRIYFDTPATGQMLVRTTEFVEDKKVEHQDLIKQTILTAIENETSFIFHSNEGITIVPYDTLIKMVITIRTSETVDL